MNPVYKLFIGDDTTGDFCRRFYFVPESTVDLTGCIGQFTIGSTVKTLQDIKNGVPVEVVFSRAETGAMTPGIKTCKLAIFDSRGRYRTIKNDILVLATDVVEEVYDGKDANEIHFTVTGGIAWEQIISKPSLFPTSWDLIGGKPALVRTVNGNSPDAMGNVTIEAGGGGGVADSPSFLGLSNIKTVVPNDSNFFTIDKTGVLSVTYDKVPLTMNLSIVHNSRLEGLDDIVISIMGNTQHDAPSGLVGYSNVVFYTPTGRLVNMPYGFNIYVGGQLYWTDYNLELGLYAHYMNIDEYGMVIGRWEKKI